MTTREEFLALRPPVEVVEIPERGLKFRVRGLTAGERERYEQDLIDVDPRTGAMKVNPRTTNLRARLVVRCVVDDSGERLFADGDVEGLAEVDAFVINALWEAARRLSGMRTEDEDEVPTSAQDGADASA